MAGVEALRPTHLVVSPGPEHARRGRHLGGGDPRLAGRVPILGVCLGHQAIGQAFGGRVVRGREPVHGKTSRIHHDGRTVFSGLEDPMWRRDTTRWWCTRTWRRDLELTAWCDDDVVMGVRHRTLPIEGVQFHPESILTGSGKALLANFLALSA